MGAYFGISNLTRKVGISGYWKNCPPTIDELKHFAKELGWDLENDLISTSSYSSCYYYNIKLDDWIDEKQDYNDETNENNKWIYYDENCKPTKDLTFYCN